MVRMRRAKGGSLAAVVARTRWQNLGVTGAVLIFMLATVGAWAIPRTFCDFNHAEVEEIEATCFRRVGTLMLAGLRLRTPDLMGWT